jgi:hypothetical protein
MRSWVRRGTLVLVLTCGVGLVVVKDRASGVDDGKAILTPDFAVGDAADDLTGSIGTIGLGGRETLALDLEQLGWIFLGVINLPDVPEVELASRTAVLPDAIALQDLPAMVTRKVPQVRNYKFVKLEDRILLVRPESRAVVAQIPRYKLIAQ